MADLGDRANVMGPQPIGRRLQPPAEMFAAVERVIELIMKADRAGLETLAVAKAKTEVAAFAAKIPSDKYTSHNIIGYAHIVQHYYVRAQVMGADGLAPFDFQIRLGEHQGRWMLWEAMNLSGGRSAWTS
jgi:hypothetical protein